MTTLIIARDPVRLRKCVYGLPQQHDPLVLLANFPIDDIHTDALEKIGNYYDARAEFDSDAIVLFVDEIRLQRPISRVISLHGRDQVHAAMIARRFGVNDGLYDPLMRLGDPRELATIARRSDFATRNHRQFSSWLDILEFYDSFGPPIQIMPTVGTFARRIISISSDEQLTDALAEGLAPSVETEVHGLVAEVMNGWRINTIGYYQCEQIRLLSGCCGVQHDAKCDSLNDNNIDKLRRLFANLFKELDMVTDIPFRATVTKTINDDFVLESCSLGLFDSPDVNETGYSMHATIQERYMSTIAGYGFAKH